MLDQPKQFTLIMHPCRKFQLFLLLCVLQNALGAKIINGREVSDSSMLYMASLQHNGQHICGGALISEDFVLTAAHCEKVTSVVLGTHHLSSASSGMKYDVKLCKHPSYEKIFQGNDIMLLKLSRKAQGATVQTVALPKGPVSLAGTSCLVAGWGYTSSHSSTVNDLRQVSVPVMSERECKRIWGHRLPLNTICTSVDNVKGFCQGDSGGPLVCNNVAVGIVSFNREAECDYKKNIFPNVYTDVSKFLPWINNIITKGDC